MLICIHTVLQDMYPDSCHISQKGWLAIAAAAIYFCLNFSPSEKYFFIYERNFQFRKQKLGLCCSGWVFFKN